MTPLAHTGLWLAAVLLLLQAFFTWRRWHGVDRGAMERGATITVVVLHVCGACAVWTVLR